VIASWPRNIQPVLDTIAESAARLCQANDALIFRVEGDSLKRIANYGPLPAEVGGGPPSIDHNTIPGRAAIDRKTIHIHDLAAVPETDLRAGFARRVGVRTALATRLGILMIAVQALKKRTADAAVQLQAYFIFNSFVVFRRSMLDVNDPPGCIDAELVPKKFSFASKY
jgi:hypothetical protein